MDIQLTQELTFILTAQQDFGARLLSINSSGAWELEFPTEYQMARCIWELDLGTKTTILGHKKRKFNEPVTVIVQLVFLKLPQKGDRNNEAYRQYLDSYIYPRKLQARTT